MHTITIKNETLNMLAEKSLGAFSNSGATFHSNNTVSIEVDDEVYDILDSRRDGITPTFDDVIKQLCWTGSVLNG